MANAQTIKIEDLGEAVTRELTMYSEEVTERVDRIGDASIKQLAGITRRTAPVGYRGKFKRSIASKRLVQKKTGSTYVWYVKPPDHRLTHLLVHGHETRNGGRTRADPFLSNAVAEVLPAYEKAVEEAIKNGK